jgi:hypothetical protein
LPRRLLPLRSLVLLVVAGLIGLAAGALTVADHRSLPAAVLVGGAAFGAALKLLHDLIE